MTVIPPEPAPPTPSAPAPGDSDKKFTQDDLTRIATREKQEGRTAAQNELLKSLGVETLDQAKDALKRQRDAEQSTLTQAQKDADKAAKDASEAAGVKAEALRERLMARVERALVRAGVADGTLDDVAKLVTVADDADADAILAAVEALKTRIPALFGPAPPEPGKGPPKPSDPGSGPRPPVPTDTQGQVKSLLEQRHGAALQRNRK